MIDKELAFRAYDYRTDSFVGDFTDGVQNYRHETTHGPYQAEFPLITGEDSSLNEKQLRAWFERRLMWRVETIYKGNVAWNGYIYSMDLERTGTHWRKSIEDMSNAITATYTDDEGNLQYITDDEGEIYWAEDTESIALYGRKERVIKVNTESGDEAMERAETELTYLASPYSTPPIYRQTRQNRLIVTLIGRHMMANHVMLLEENLRQTAAHLVDGGYAYRNDTTVSAEILRILELVEELSGWIYPLNISTGNDTATKMGVPSAMGAWDRVVELSRLRDSGGNHYRLTVEQDGGVIYLPFNEAPDYYFKPEPDRIVYPDETRPKWEAKPGIIRVLDTAIGPSLPDTWLTDRRNIFAERTTMRDGDEFASFHTHKYSVTDWIRAVEANTNWIERDDKR